jgi:long-subunit fatty acid transport protein
MNNKGRFCVCVISACLALLLYSNNGLQAATLFQQVGVSSSPNPVGSGARAMGMGGAFIAIADDATAASWNPAGLIQLEKPELSIVGTYLSRKEEFSSSSHAEIDNSGEVYDTNINYFSAAYPFHYYRNIVVSINYQRLYEFKRRFDYRLDSSSAGLDLLQNKRFKQNGYVGALGLAAAIEITPRFSFGATLNIWTEDLFWRNGWKETYSERGVGTVGGNPVTIDTHITDKYSDFGGVNANFGLLWNATQNLTLGAVIKTPFDANIRHEFSFNQTTVLGPPADATVTSQQNFKEEVELRLPLSYGLGLSWRFSDAFTMGIDVYRTEWSKYILTDGQGSKFSPIDGRPKGESHIKDTTQIRIGGEYLFILPENNIVVPVRAGFFYDPEPSHGKVNDFYGVSLGSGIAYKRFIFDVAYQLRWGNNIDTGDLIATSKADVTQHSFLASVIYHF